MASMPFLVSLSAEQPREQLHDLLPDERRQAERR
jgi:hypothetical protein